MEIKDRILKLLVGGQVGYNRSVDAARERYLFTVGAVGKADPKVLATEEYLALVKALLEGTSANVNRKEVNSAYETAYNNATQVLKGTFDPSEHTYEYTGRRPKKQGAYLADVTAAAFFKNTQLAAPPSEIEQEVGLEEASEESTMPSTGTGDGSYKKQFTYKSSKLLEGLGSQFKGINESFDSTIKRYAKILLNNLEKAKDAVSNGGILDQGITIEQEHLDTLRKIVNGELNDSEAYNALGPIASAYKESLLNFDAWFKTYVDEIEGRTAEAAAEAATHSGEASLDKDIALNNWHIVEKDGKKYIYDSEDQLVTNKVVYNDDWTAADSYKHGYVIGLDGTFATGDLSLIDKNSPYFSTLNSYLALLKLANDNRFFQEDTLFNADTDLAEHASFEVINKAGDKLNGKKIIDLDPYFEGDLKVIAITKENDVSKYLTPEGHFKFTDPNITLFTLDLNGNLHSGTYDLIKDYLPQVTIHSDETIEGGVPTFTNLTEGLNSIDFSTLVNGRGNSLKNLEGLDANLRRDFVNLVSPNYNNKRNRVGNAGQNEWNENDSFNLDRDLLPQLDQVTRFLLYFYANRDKKAFTQELKEFYAQYNPRTMAWIIQEALRRNPKLFDGAHKKDYLDAWRRFLLNNHELIMNEVAAVTEELQVASEKNGGVLYAASGTRVTDLSGNIIESLSEDASMSSTAARMRQKTNADKKDDKIREDAAKHGKTFAEEVASQDNWTKSDTLRAAALAQDVFGLIAAISGAATGGAGSVAAEVSGFTSMATDFAADLLDPSMSASLVGKNVLVNTGLALGSFVGAKAPKIIKSVSKLLPRAAMAAATAGVAFDEDVWETVNNVNKGKNLTTNDYRNILLVLRTVTGISRYGASEVTSHKVNKRLKETNLIKDENITMLKSADGKKSFRVKDLNEEELDQALKALRYNDVKNDAGEVTEKGAYTILKEAGLNDSDAKAVVKEHKDGVGWKTHRIGLKDASVDRAEYKTDDAAIAEELGNLLREYGEKLNGWQNWMRHMDRMATKVANPFKKVPEGELANNIYSYAMMREKGLNPKYATVEELYNKLRSKPGTAAAVTGATDKIVKLSSSKDPLTKEELKELRTNINNMVKAEGGTPIKTDITTNNNFKAWANQLRKDGITSLTLELVLNSRETFKFRSGGKINYNKLRNGSKS